MQNNIQQQYINLVKKTLTFDLWNEPPISVKALNYSRPFIKRKIIDLTSFIFKKVNMEIVQDRKITSKERIEGTFWPSYAFTMVGHKRLDNLHKCMEIILEESIPGDLIETGVWRGGSCILMKSILKAYNQSDRRVYVADSFEGLPKPNAEKYIADQGDTLYTHKYLAISKEEVENNFRKFDLLDDQVIFLKGWFKDTLPNTEFGQFALIRLDGDMYESTMDSLNSLYHKLSPGGFCIIDDYGLETCEKAVNDFRKKHNITEKITIIDGTGCFWRKNK